MNTASLYMVDFSCIKITRGLSPALLPRFSNFTPSDAKREFDLSAAWLDAVTSWFQSSPTPFSDRRRASLQQL